MKKKNKKNVKKNALPELKIIELGETDGVEGGNAGGYFYITGSGGGGGVKVRF